MAKKEQSRPSLKKIRGLQLSMIIGYAVIIIAVICVVTNLAVKKTDAVLKNKVISMTSSLNVQMKLNMDSYISRMETIGTLAFGTPIITGYLRSEMPILRCLSKRASHFMVMLLIFINEYSILCIGIISKSNYIGCDYYVRISGKCGWVFHSPVSGFPPAPHTATPAGC